MLARLKITAALNGVRSKILTNLRGKNRDRFRYTCNTF